MTTFFLLYVVPFQQDLLVLLLPPSLRHPAAPKVQFLFLTYLYSVPTIPISQKAVATYNIKGELYLPLLNRFIYLFSKNISRYMSVIGVRCHTRSLNFYLFIKQKEIINAYCITKWCCMYYIVKIWLQ